LRERAKAGVDTILFACTDLSVIPENYRTINVIDSSKELAKALIEAFLKL
jgi:aspartate/glutamate racemase